ncbi:BBE domain-containing protein [Clostridium botulinum]|uniref:BBE domain-containing protein n=1 Tax=Clostridium botulinum TaxID=1491 RepID=UPI001070C38D|nr:BBE domain-containing protein [Clostridium botulinum]MBY6795733.1 BBE domain-containing protein [Clostridium botulinum]MBY6865336.1 BBE domain-containing protein [Clostridium botulinum]MBY6871971.1 BBE domain-containing protein [Clostridium botulinum]MBY6887162.1 BBE domain-containing protein [Clostridium botulinum]MCC5423323.1 BBE domain-containing protein [Clostridium botulinum]
MFPFTWDNYVNGSDFCIEDWPMVYYGRNFNLLTQVKAKYDSENIFRFPQSIPPASECD